MKKELRDRLPTWHKDLDGKNAILTGDIDSLFSYYLLEKRFNINAMGFYNFKSIYFGKGDRNNTFGLDMDTIPTSKTFGNHFTYFHKNDSAINLNNYIGNIKYYQKYPFSTVMLILSLYDFDMESMTDEQLKIILCIDSAYKGYYSDKQFFKDIYTTWLDRLEMRFLVDRILKNMTIKDFIEINKKYNLSGSIKVNKDGYLETDIDLDKISNAFNDTIELTTLQFNLHRTYNYKAINPNRQSIPDKEDIISMAWTYKNELKMTIK